MKDASMPMTKKALLNLKKVVGLRNKLYISKNKLRQSPDFNIYIMNCSMIILFYQFVFHPLPDEFLQVNDPYPLT